MKRVLLRTLVLSSVIALCAPAQESPNAALLYWQAFALMPENDIPEDLWETKLNEEAMAYLESAPIALGLLHRATEGKSCDWGIAWDRGPGTLMPHLSEARALGRLACFRARLHISRGRARSALEDFRAVLVLARHVGKDATLVGAVVQFTMQKHAVDGVVRHFGYWSKEDLAWLREALDQLPSGGNIVEGIQKEKDLFGGWLRRYLQGVGGEDGLDVTIDRVVSSCEPTALEALGKLTDDELRGLAAQLDAVSDAHYAELAKAIRLPEMKKGLVEPLRLLERMLAQAPAEEREDLAELVRLLAESKVRAQEARGDLAVAELLTELESNYTELIRISSLPYPDWLNEGPAFEQRLASADPLSRLLAQSTSKAYAREAVAKVRLAILRAAIAWKTAGTEAFEAIRDPYGDGPFELTPSADHARIASALKLDGEPVSLELLLATEPPTEKASGPAPIQKVPEEEEIRRVLSRLRELQDPDGPTLDEVEAKLRQAFKHIGNELPHLDIDEATGEQVLSIFVAGTADFANVWVPIIEEGLAKDGSARRATILLANQDLPLAMFRHTSKLRRQELEDLLGRDVVAAVLGLLP